MLKDTFQRAHNYLRISLTDACNFRCLYCMPESMHFMPSARLMNAEEIQRIAECFVRLGTTKIRLTGGEPLVRKDARPILHQLSTLPVELTLTSNGYFVHEFITDFLQAGIRSVNISLDTLNPARFKTMTRRDGFQQVWNNILSLIENGIRVKINCVAMKGINDDEVIQFVALTKELPVHVRFIEFMPFHKNAWQGAAVLPFHEMMQQIESQFTVIKLRDEQQDTTKKFIVPGHAGTFAAITTMTQPFCSGCNRMRLTADGKMKNCLFSQDETDILTALRNGLAIEPLIRQNILEKKLETGGQLLRNYEHIDPELVKNRPMIQIGG